MSARECTRRSASTISGLCSGDAHKVVCTVAGWGGCGCVVRIASGRGGSGGSGAICLDVHSDPDVDVVDDPVWD